MSYKKIQKNLEDLSAQRDKRCGEVVKIILKMVGDSDVSPVPPRPGKDGTRADFVREYDPLTREILELLKEKEIPLDEFSYIGQLLMVPFDHLTRYVNESINMNVAKVLESYWGKEEKSLTLKDVEEKLAEQHTNVV